MFNAAEVDGRRIEHPAHGNRHVLLGDVGLFGDEFEQAFAFFLLMLEQFLDLLREQQAILDQGVGDAFSKSFDGRHRAKGDYRKAF